MQRQDDVGQLRQRRIGPGDCQNACAVVARQFHRFNQLRGDPGQRADNHHLFGTEAGGGDTHHHCIVAHRNRIAEAHQAHLQFIAAQGRTAAHAEGVNHPRLAQQFHRIGETRLIERGQVLAQGRLDVAHDLPVERRLLGRARRVEKPAADAAGLGQLQAQVTQVLAADRTGEPRQRGAADLRPQRQFIEAGGGGKSYVVEHQAGDASFTGAEGVLTGADLVEDVHASGSG
ncbi:hypothetical protein D3C87_1059720 [compost metagenome]